MKIKFQELAKKLGKKQVDIAHELGVTQPELSRLLNHGGMPRGRILANFEQVFGCSPDAVDFTPPPKRGDRVSVTEIHNYGSTDASRELQLEREKIELEKRIAALESGVRRACDDLIAIQRILADGKANKDAPLLRQSLLPSAMEDVALACKDLSACLPSDDSKRIEDRMIRAWACSPSNVPSLPDWQKAAGVSTARTVTHHGDGHISGDHGTVHIGAQTGVPPTRLRAPDEYQRAAKATSDTKAFLDLFPEITQQLRVAMRWDGLTEDMAVASVASAIGFTTSPPVAILTHLRKAAKQVTNEPRKRTD